VSLALLDDTGQAVAAAGYNGRLQIFDLRHARAPLLSLVGHRSGLQVRPIAVDASRSTVFAVEEDDCVRAWSLTSGKLLNRIDASGVRAVAWGSDGLHEGLWTGDEGHLRFFRMPG
jgi:WD40 repeat protein